jgi:hypothetical protein
MENELSLLSYEETSNSLIKCDCFAISRPEDDSVPLVTAVSFPIARKTLLICEHGCQKWVGEDTIMEPLDYLMAL